MKSTQIQRTLSTFARNAFDFYSKIIPIDLVNSLKISILCMCFNPSSIHQVRGTNIH